jgi:hypothetical protein
LFSLITPTTSNELPLEIYASIAQAFSDPIALERARTARNLTEFLAATKSDEKG